MSVHTGPPGELFPCLETRTLCSEPLGSRRGQGHPSSSGDFPSWWLLPARQEVTTGCPPADSACEPFYGNLTSLLWGFSGCRLFYFLVNQTSRGQEPSGRRQGAEKARAARSQSAVSPGPPPPPRPPGAERPPGVLRGLSSLSTPHVWG